MKGRKLTSSAVQMQKGRGSNRQAIRESRLVAPVFLFQNILAWCTRILFACLAWLNCCSRLKDWNGKRWHCGNSYWCLKKRLSFPLRGRWITWRHLRLKRRCVLEWGSVGPSGRQLYVGRCVLVSVVVNAALVGAINTVDVLCWGITTRQLGEWNTNVTLSRCQHCLEHCGMIGCTKI